MSLGETNIQTNPISNVNSDVQVAKLKRFQPGRIQKSGFSIYLGTYLVMDLGRSTQWVRFDWCCHLHDLLERFLNTGIQTRNLFQHGLGVALWGFNLWFGWELLFLDGWAMLFHVKVFVPSMNMAIF